MFRNKNKAFCLQHGASLLEVLIAILVLSIGLIGALKMQSEAVRQNANSRYVSLAGIHAMQIMEAVKAGSACSCETTIKAGYPPEDKPFKEIIKSNLPSGNCEMSPVDAKCKIIIKWRPPGSSDEQQATYALDPSPLPN